MPGARRRGDVTVLRGATLIDGTGRPPVRDAAVVIAGEWIVWAGTVRDLRAPRGARVVDLRGKFLLPGLWDMHSHGTYQERIGLPLLIANGVTGVRDMWGTPPLFELRGRIEKGEVLGPRQVIASNVVDGPVSLLGPPVTKVATEAEAREAVHAARELGADFMKVYSYLEPHTYRAILGEARRLGLPVGGHLPYLVPAAEASRAGHRAFEHLFGQLLAVSSREEEFRRRMAETPIDPARPRVWFDMVREFERLAAESQDEARAREFHRMLRRNRTWQSPTLTVLRVISSPLDTYANDPRLKYVTAADRELWVRALKLFAPVTPEQIAAQRRYFRNQLAIVGRMHRAGVGVLGGTDCMNPYVFPGFSAHDELELLVSAGLSPMAAIQTMTRDAARYLGRSATTGTVAPGRAADLFAVEANPLADIRNTARVHSVVVRGRYISPGHRQRLLDDAEAAAGDPATPALARPVCACHGL
ncbi:amidohydrolase [Bailinhaonella thermotolerans]|uniref:Amidohydrolase n=2 Tax=Bailinhaonella thermotolerans TaxID=1070861 RepID=A0A3A4ADM1_9ACTN|nr:amidohydrolase [Bailinhaonella thermotolerans]